jgi:hypothetical protein
MGKSIDGMAKADPDRAGTALYCKVISAASLRVIAALAAGVANDLGSHFSPNNPAGISWKSTP